MEREDRGEKEERVSLFTIRHIWVDLALAVFSLQVIVYAFFLIRYEVAKGNAVMETLQVLIAQLAATMAVASGTTLILLQGVDFVMFLTQRYLKRLDREKREARAEGKVEGKAEERELWTEWNNRRIEAEAKGEAFNEPPPTENDTPSD